MNFCFNCGAKLVEKDQKFCIQCGIELKRGDVNLESGDAEASELVSNYYNSSTEEKSFGQDDMENNTFLNSEDDFDEDDLDKIFLYLKDIANSFAEKQSKLIEEFTDVSFEDNSPSYDEASFESNFPSNDGADDSNPIVISEFPSGRPIAYVSNNMVKKSAFGRPMYFIDGNYVRDGPMGRPVYYIDGDYIKKGNSFGRILYVIDGNFIKEGSVLGKIVAKIDRLTFGY